MNIVKNVETPYYIIDENKLEKNLKDLEIAFNNKFQKNVIYSYSFKTNSLPWILNWFKSKNVYAEVVSEEEYNLAKFIGYPSSNIILNGPFKGEKCIEEALNNGAIINLDSFNEIEWIKKNKNKIKVNKWKVGLRINFDLEKYCPNESMMGDQPGRFGFNMENDSFKNAIEELERLNYVEIVGLHGHNSTKTKSLKVFKIISSKLIEASFMIKNKLEYLDIGGCIFGDKPGQPTFDQYAEVIHQEVSKKYKNGDIKIILEPGAALIASPINYICKTIDVKKIKGDSFISTDGSLHHINPSMSGIKLNIKSNSKSKKIIEKQIITGYTCIEKDRIAIINNDIEYKEGTFISVENVGAYSMALSPLFIKYFPCVYVLKNNKYYLVRSSWGINEYMSKSILDYSCEVRGF